MADVLVVDRRGLARKLANRPKAFILYELLQNSWDEKVSHVQATAEMIPGRPACRITVEDDCPEGFADLRSIFTLFRDSKKAPDPTKRGRFELGEKMVLALALDAKITTTQGTVIIDGDVRKQSREKREFGTLFTATFKMTREEYDRLVDDVFCLIPPPIPTTFNGEGIPIRKLLHSFETTLPTVCVDADGNLCRTTRKTTVNVYEPNPGEQASLYEMGLPVVQTGDKWHYDVQQRVPVNWERNNVPAGYLSTLRVYVLNAMHDKVLADEATEAWVRDASSDPRCEREAFNDVIVKRFGDKRAVRDPNDPESASRAVAAGYELIGGRTLSPGEWGNARRFESVQSSGILFPTPHAYSNDPNAKEVTIVPPEKYSSGMKTVVDYSREIGSLLIERALSVDIVHHNGAGGNFGAAFMRDVPLLHFNVFRLGRAWFNNGISIEVDRLLIHELAHNYESNHLSDKFHDACCRLGAKLKKLAIDRPELFQKYAK